MPRDITVTLKDGSTHVYKGAPDDITPDAVTARASKDFGQAVDHLDGGRAAPAPRWDILGDIGRSASASAGAFKEDLSSAFPDPLKMDLGPLATIKRMGSALKVPLDAAGVALSPLTGAVHGTLGSALSYAIPTPGRDIESPIGGTFYSDPKKAADQIIDSSLALAAPRGIGSVEAVTNAGITRGATQTARTEAKLKNKAIERVNARVAEDDLNPDDVFSAQQAANANGDKITLMDLGNKNVRGLAGAVYRAPGKAGREIDQFLEGRDQAASGSLTSDVQGGVAKGSSYHTVNDLTKARSTASRPAYEAAENVGPVHSERLDRFLTQPEVQEGIRRGLKLERQAAVAEDRPFVDSDYGVIGYKDDNWDMPIFGKVPTMKQLIVANEGMGAKVGEMVDQFGRLTKDGVYMKKLHESYLGELDRLNPKYASARKEWSGPSQSMNAVREGREHFTRSESNEQLAAEFGKLSEADKDFYRMGAAEAKVDAIERAPDASDKSKRVINSERDRKRFRILFGSEAEAERFISSVARKRAAFETKQAVKGGSQTAGRVADDTSENIPLGLDAAHGLGSAASGNWLGAAHSLYKLKRDLGLRNNPALNSEIASILTNPNLPWGNGGLLTPLPLPKIDHYLGAPAISGTLLPNSLPRKKR